MAQVVSLYFPMPTVICISVCVHVSVCTCVCVCVFCVCVCVASMKQQRWEVLKYTHGDGGGRNRKTNDPGWERKKW